MSFEPLPFDESDLPTSRHSEALLHVLEELEWVDHLLLVSGSVAQRRATAESDIDLVVVVENSETCGGVASLAVSVVIDAADRHDVVSVTRFLSGVKVSLRIVRAETVRAFFAGKELTIWKTHSVLHKRDTPELLISAAGQAVERPFREVRSKSGYAYDVHTHTDDDTPLLSVESTMLLTSKVVRRQGIQDDVAAAIASAALPAERDDRFRVTEKLITAGFLDPNRAAYIADLQPGT